VISLIDPKKIKQVNKCFTHDIHIQYRA